MLEKLREGSQGVIVKIILVLVILSFALAGIGSYISSPKQSVAATVNGQDITLAEFERAYQSERSRLESQFGEAFALISNDDAYMAQVRRSVLDTLINRTLLDQAADDLGMTVGDEELRSAIAQMSEFQVDGEFNYERYKVLLSRANLQTEQFYAIMRSDLTRMQIQSALLATEFALPGETRQLADLSNQTRSARYIQVPVSAFNDDVEVSDEEIQSYFDENQSRFLTPEYVDLEYILVDAALLAENIEIDADQARDYYDTHQDEYQQAEKRRVAHILISSGDDKTLAEQTIQGIAQQLEQGADFAELAKAKSDDSFSGKNGGELDWFEKGVMDPAFEEAAFAMTQPDQVSDIVESSFGYHIIKLLDVSDGQVADFADVESGIVEMLKQDVAVEEYYELAQQLSELSFELPDSLQEVADEMGVNMLTATQVSRSTLPAAINQAQVSQVAFSEDAINEQLNSDIINLSDSKSLVLRVSDYHEAQVKPVDEVRDQVVEQLTQQKASQASQEFAAQLLAVMGNAEALQPLLDEKGLEVKTEAAISRRDNRLDSQVTAALFAMAKPQDDQFATQQVTAASGDQYVLELTATALKASSDEEVAAVSQQLAAMHTDSDYQALLAYLKAQADISYDVQ